MDKLLTDQFKPEEIFGADLPWLLFHYSSASGILGILESNSIWSSTVDGLNDLKEMDHASDVLTHSFSNWLRVRGLIDETKIKILSKELVSHRNRNTGICVCSFSEEGDLLSQWRADGADGRGISLGFNSILLKRDASSFGQLLGRCVYDSDVQYKICSQYLDLLLQKFSIDWYIFADYWSIPQTPSIQG